MRTNDESKLPRWAQQEMTRLRDRLREDVAYWKAKAHQATTPGESDTILVDGMAEHGLPAGSTVRFMLRCLEPEDAHTQTFIDVRVKDDRLELTAGDVVPVIRPAAPTISGGLDVTGYPPAMQVEPRASNTIYVWVR